MTEIVSIKRVNGIAGQYGYDVVTRGQSHNRVRFQTVGEGGPVLMLMDAVNAEGDDFTWQVWVDHDVNVRCGGVLSPEWIRKFYA